jgi:hypothetical protein
MSKKPNAAALAPAKPAPVTVIPFAPETAPKPKGKQGGKVTETFIDQYYVDAFLNAENGVKEAAVALFIACTHHRVSPAQFVGRSDAKVRASEFNTAYTARMLMGQTKAAQYITTAAAKPGDKRANVLAALRSVKSASAELKGSALKGAALSKEIAKRADAAAVKAADAHKAKRDSAKQERAARVPVPKGNSVAAFAPMLLAALTDSLAKMAKVEVKQPQMAKWRELASAMEEAADICAALVKA